MKVSLRSLHSPDLSNLETAAPLNPEHFGILVQAMIGPIDKKGEESFDILVCTPSWLAENTSSDTYTWGKHYLFVSKYEFTTIYQAIEQLCSSIDTPDWSSAAMALGQYGKWEFENYTP